MIWACLATALLVLPRFFLIPVDDTGVRVEDILLLMLVPSTIQILSEQQQIRPVVRAFKLYLLIVVLASVSSAVSGGMSLPVALAFGLRPSLYFCGFVIGYRLGWRGMCGVPGLLVIFCAVLPIHLFYGLGAALDVFPNVASFDPGRLAGLTNGPYDLSAMACLLCVVFLRARRRLPLAAGILALILTQSRVALAAFILHATWSSIKGRTWIRWAMPAAAIFFLGLVVSMRDTDGVNLADTYEGMFDLAAAFSEVATTREDYLDAAYSEAANAEITSGDGDPSALLRIARWSMVWATAWSSISNLLLGMGPGYYSVALDGNFVRLLAETGLLGLLSYLLIGFRLYQCVGSDSSKRLLLALMIQLAVVAVFIDIFVSLKTMCLFWMIVGAIFREEYSIT